MTKPRVGPRMKSIADYVSAVPGCSKAAALRGVGLPDRGMGAYRPMSRAIAAGLVIVEQARRGGPYLLFASERDRRMFHLRAELLHGSPTPERAAELAATIERLREGAGGRVYGGSGRPGTVTDWVETLRSRANGLTLAR
jgi:hypothetical protein